MIITKEFINEVLVKANKSLSFSNSRLEEKVTSFAYTLEGEEHSTALNKLSVQMGKATQVSNGNRNAYVPFFNALYNTIDFGFSVGEVVKYWFSPHTQRVGPIQAINGGEVVFKDVITSMLLVSKNSPEQVQLSLF